MRRRIPRRVTRALLLAGAALLAVDLILVAVLHGPAPGGPRTVATTAPPAPATTAAPSTRPATTAAPAPAPAPPPAVPMSFAHAGALVWHDHDSDPEWLGRTLRSAGFGWVAVYVADGADPAPLDEGWIARFRQASGLPVGGWSSLGADPAADAELAARQIRADGLSFYIADAEAAFEGAGYGRSRAFVAAFRAAEPSLPAALSSFCDARGLDLAAWAGAGFAFLPQAYVNDFGDGVAPAACVHAAEPYFAPEQIHPTVGGYFGKLGRVPPSRYALLLARAGTTGFSVYPAEVAMTAPDWRSYGRAIRSLHIAAPLR